jgi:chromosome segregation ATPase
MWFVSRKKAQAEIDMIEGYRSFSIEWRDQSIRRLEELLKITQDQLDETARRKGIRDEENNKLRGEVDRLRDAAKKEFDDVEKLSNEVERLKRERDVLTRRLDREASEISAWSECCDQYIEANDKLKAKVECYKNAIEAINHWMKEKDETILRLSKEIERRLADNDAEDERIVRNEKYARGKG